VHLVMQNTLQMVQPSTACLLACTYIMFTDLRLRTLTTSVCLRVSFTQVLEDVDHLLEPKDREELEAARFPVQLCTDKLSDLVFGLKSCPGISQNLVALMDSSIRGVLINASACARIVTTPLPFAYIVHLR
jgi:predicted membrane chloride channel (bestrophin family)